MSFYDKFQYHQRYVPSSHQQFIPSSILQPQDSIIQPFRDIMPNSQSLPNPFMSNQFSSIHAAAFSGSHQSHEVPQQLPSQSQSPLHALSQFILSSPSFSLFVNSLQIDLRTSQQQEMQLERVREMCNELDTNDDATSSFTSSSMSQGNTSSFNGRDMQHTSLMKPDSSMFSSVFIGLFQPVPIFCIPNRLRSYIPHLIADAPSLAGAAYSPLTSIPMQPDRFAPSTVISAASSTDQYRCPTSNQSSSQNDQLYQLFPPSEIESMQNAAMADLSHVSSSELTLLALLPPSSLPQHIKDILGLSSSPYLSSDSFYQPSDAQQSTMDSSFASSSSSSSPSSSSSSISSSSSSPSSSSAHPTSLADAYDDPFRSENSPLIDSDGMLQGFQGIPSAASAAIGGGGGGGGGGEGPLLRQASFPEMQWGDEEQICFDVDHHRMYCVVNEMNMKLSLRSILNALQLSLDSFTHSLRSRIEQPLQFPSYSSSDASTIPLILQSSSTAASTPSPLPPNPSRKEPLPMSYNETYFQNDELPSESEARQGESPS